MTFLRSSGLQAMLHTMSKAPMTISCSAAVAVSKKVSISPSTSTCFCTSLLHICTQALLLFPRHPDPWHCKMLAQILLTALHNRPRSRAQQHPFFPQMHLLPVFSLTCVCACVCARAGPSVGVQLNFVCQVSCASGPETATNSSGGRPANAADIPSDSIFNPPYAINNGNQQLVLGTKSLPVTAVHHDGEIEYNLHNLYGLYEVIASYRQLITMRQRRPFILTRYVWTLPYVCPAVPVFHSRYVAAQG